MKRRFQFENIAKQIEKHTFHWTIYFYSNVEKFKCYIDLISHVQVNITYGFFSRSLGINQSDSQVLINHIINLFNILQTFCQSRCASLAQFSSESELEKIVNEIRGSSLHQSGRRFILDTISSSMLKLYLSKSLKNKKDTFYILGLFLFL